MPQVFRFGSYWIYFWTNENKPLEPIHVHISNGSLLQIFESRVHSHESSFQVSFPHLTVRLTVKIQFPPAFSV